MTVSLFAPDRLPPVDERAALRYSGAREETPAVRALLQECLALAGNAAAPAVCWLEAPLTFGETLGLGFAETASRDLRRALTGCGSSLVFCATVGLEFDRLIARYRFEPAKALMLQAIGTERVEALCDLFCDTLGKTRPLTPRFSPGYGDLPLSFQTAIFAALDPPKHLGVTLGETLLMTPSKSVTALAGFREKQ